MDFRKSEVPVEALGCCLAASADVSDSSRCYGGLTAISSFFDGQLVSHLTGSYNYRSGRQHNQVNNDEQLSCLAALMKLAYLN